jgi:superfamily II DNA or RNA helicase
MELRTYQQASVEMTKRSLAASKKTPVIVLPTGAGKTPVISEFIKLGIEKGKRGICLTHTRQLVRQLRDTASEFIDPRFFGVHCDGLNRRDFIHPIISATYQSALNFYTNKKNKFEDRLQLVDRDFVIVDECHLVGDRKQGDKQRQYIQLLDAIKNANPASRLIGLTATPFRLNRGYITGNEPGDIFNTLIEAPGSTIPELIQGGYLSDVVTPEPDELMTGETASKLSEQLADLAINSRNGDFKEEELLQVVNEEELVRLSVESTIRICEKQNRRSVMIFCVNIEHAENVFKEFQKQTSDPVGIIHSKRKISTDGRTRSVADNDDFEIQAFTKGHRRYFINVGKLTTGFDFKGISCICLYRPTASVVLYSQMAGRGLRVDDGKENCLLLDYGQNIERHGPLDELIIRPRAEGNGKKRTTASVTVDNRLANFDGDEEEEEKELHRILYSSANAISDGRGFYEVIGGEVLKLQGGIQLSFRINFGDKIVAATEFVSLNNDGAIYYAKKVFKTFTGLEGEEMPLDRDKLYDMLKHERKPQFIKPCYSKPSKNGKRYLNVKTYKFSEGPKVLEFILQGESIMKHEEVKRL